MHCVFHQSKSTYKTTKKEANINSLQPCLKMNKRYSELNSSSHLNSIFLYIQSQDDCDLCLESLRPVLIQPIRIQTSFIQRLSLEICKRHTANKKKIQQHRCGDCKKLFSICSFAPADLRLFFCVSFQFDYRPAGQFPLDSRAARLLHIIIANIEVRWNRLFAQMNKNKRKAKKKKTFEQCDVFFVFLRQIYGQMQG